MKKYNLLFDGSILINEFIKSDARSGIFFTTKNLFDNLLKRNDINLFLYCDYGKISMLLEYLKKYHLDIEIINAKEYKFLQLLKEKIRYQKSITNKNQHPIKRTIYSFSYAFISSVLKGLELLPFHFELKKRLKKIDFFFSPCTKTPKVILDNKSIVTSVYLYDTIPLLFPEYNPHFKSGCFWFSSLVKSLNKNEIYFSISESTKRDFLNFSTALSANQITVASLAAANYFKKINDKQKIEETKKKYNIPNDKKYIFSLCTLEPRKNLIRAVKTFIKFIEKNNIDDLVYVLGGGHWDNFISQLESEIDDLGKYKEKIVRAGYIDDEDLSVLYSGAQWFVYTSQYEGFGLPPLEAMSCGCAVITSNNSSLPEVVGDAGIMVDFDSDEQHINAYEKYYFNNELKDEYSRKGLERARLFSWEKCVDIIVEKLKEEKIRRCQKLQ